MHVELGLMLISPDKIVTAPVLCALSLCLELSICLLRFLILVQIFSQNYYHNHFFVFNPLSLPSLKKEEQYAYHRFKRLRKHRQSP